MADLHARLRRTDILAWPAAVQALAWRMPLMSLPVERGPAGGLITTAPMPDLAPTDLMPKLAIKSWQETGRLRMIPGGQPLAPAVQARLASPTAQHLMILPAWFDADTPPCLHLFEWTDMGGVSEARYLCTPEASRRLSLCQRNTAALPPAVIDPLIAAVRSGIPDLGGFILQVAVPPNGQARILDINPALGSAEVASLGAQAWQGAAPRSA